MGPLNSYPTFGFIPVSCLICWLSLAVFLAMLWVFRRLILSFILSVSVFLYLSAKIMTGRTLNKVNYGGTTVFLHLLQEFKL